MNAESGRRRSATAARKARRYRTADLKLLFALSYNRCARPGCQEPIVADATGYDEAKVVGQIAHIVASSSEGPRGDPHFPPEKLYREPNLILLCPTDHRIIDGQPGSYSVAQLQDWKDGHRRRYTPAAVTSEARAATRTLVPWQVPPPRRTLSSGTTNSISSTG